MTTIRDDPRFHVITESQLERMSAMPTKYQYELHTFIVQQAKPGMPPVNIGKFDFLCKTDDLGKAHLIGTLMGNAGHRVVIGRPGDKPVDLLVQLMYRFPKERFELVQPLSEADSGG